MAITETIGTRTVRYFARIIVGGLIATGLIGGGYKLADFNSAGKVSPTTSYVAAEYLNAYITNTGSTTIKYPAICLANPLAALGAGSGTVTRLTFQAGANPTGVGGDIGFVKSCADGGGSGASLIDNTCTTSGCLSTYTTGTALWNGADYIKFTPRAALAPGFTGRIRLEYEDLFGE